MGVPPSMALLCHFLSLQLTAANQRSGCVSLCITKDAAGNGINMDLAHEVEGFRQQHVYVDAA